MLAKMPGDRWQKLANLRALYAFMWAHPGKKLLFMGDEIAQEREWSEERSLDWHLLENAQHRGVQSLVRDLNRALPRESRRCGSSTTTGTAFRWLEPNDAATSVFAFARFSRDGASLLVCVCNLTPCPRYGYRLGLPRPGRWREVLNTDAGDYGGSGVGNLGGVDAEESPWHDQPYSGRGDAPASRGRLARAGER